MTSSEMRAEIYRLIDDMPEHKLRDLLEFIESQKKQLGNDQRSQNFNKILKEDIDLLKRLTK